MKANPKTREKLVAETRALLLSKGHSATRVEEICRRAGLTKGAFFHYFADKDAAGRAAVEDFVAGLVERFAAAAFTREADPRKRAIAYIDFVAELCEQPILRKGCLLGMYAQELAPTHSDVKRFCAAAFSGWAASFAGILSEAKKASPDASFDSDSVAFHFLAVLEGALLLAKAQGSTAVVQDSLKHFKNYVRMLLAKSPATA